MKSCATWSITAWPWPLPAISWCMLGPWTGCWSGCAGISPPSPELTFAEFRELSGLSRKLGIPLLEYLDRSGATVRQKDVRLAGPGLDRKR